jgi:hypothetical protein
VGRIGSISDIKQWEYYYNNTIYKLSFRSKKIIKVILNSITRIRLIIYIKDSKETFSVDYIYIKEDTKVEETIIVDIITTTHFVKSDVIFIINLDTS